MFRAGAGAGRGDHIHAAFLDDGFQSSAQLTEAVLGRDNLDSRIRRCISRNRALRCRRGRDQGGQHKAENKFMYWTVSSQAKGHSNLAPRMLRMERGAAYQITARRDLPDKMSRDVGRGCAVLCVEFCEAQRRVRAVRLKAEFRAMDTVGDKQGIETGGAGARDIMMQRIADGENTSRVCSLVVQSHLICPRCRLAVPSYISSKRFITPRDNAWTLHQFALRRDADEISIRANHW